MARNQRQARRTKPLDVAALIEKMKLVVLPTEKLTPYAKNPRINDGGVDAVANSIKKFGFADPIVVHGPNNEIVNGHTRWKAAKQLGLKRVPCLRGDYLTEAEIRAFRIADNKTHELSSWDDGLLRLEIADLPDFNFEDFGFDPPATDGTDEAGTGDGAQGGDSAGNYNIVYEIVFDDETQQDAWFKFLRKIKAAYDGETIAEQLVQAIADWEASHDA